MRSDMYEILIERPRKYRGCRTRVGCRYPRKTLSRARDLGDLPMREGMGHAYAEKSLNENLKPFERFLRGSVGRPWHKVYAEIRAQVDGGSAVQMHILEHLDGYVELHVREVDGVLYGGGRYGGPSPLLTSRYRDTFYVCPRSGILKQVPQRPRKSTVPDPRIRKISDTHYWVKRPGGWFEVWLTERPAWNAPRKNFVDVLSGLAIDTSKHRQALRLMGCAWVSTHYAIRIRQLGKRELRAVFQKR